MNNTIIPSNQAHRADMIVETSDNMKGESHRADMISSNKSLRY
ncbi:MAG: hypothetical protein ACOVO9_09340 [Bacteroidia bacterium]